MTRLAMILAVVLGGPVAAQTCFIDAFKEQAGKPEFDLRVRALSSALAPVEYRKSCGIRDDTDTRYFEAVRERTGCAESALYMDLFGGDLTETETYRMAVKRTDLRTDADFETYCTIVERIDLGDAVTDTGALNAEAMQMQVPLFHAIQELIATRRLAN